MTHIQQLLAQNVKTARKHLGITQTQLAEKIGVSVSFVAEVEIARKFPSAPNLQKFADSLGLQPYQLFYDKTHFHKEMDKTKLLGKVRADLKNRLIADLDEVISKHLK
jgi:transcriptional regulator with XRE-family HTH domain